MYLQQVEVERREKRGSRREPWTLEHALELAQATATAAAGGALGYWILDRAKP